MSTVMRIDGRAVAIANPSVSQTTNMVQQNTTSTPTKSVKPDQEEDRVDLDLVKRDVFGLNAMEVNQGYG